MLRRRDGPAAAPWGTISREDIVQAALTIVRAGGYEDMTIRALAAELGVAPRSLYRHIRDKDDLLDEVVDRLLAETWHPSAAADNWPVGHLDGPHPFLVALFPENMARGEDNDISG